MDIAFTVNREARHVGVPETTSLLEVLRNHLGLMGTRYGCGLEQCGSCMVLVDGQPVLVSQRAGVVALDGEREITFGPDDRLTITLRERAFRSIEVADCLRYAATQGLLRAQLSATSGAGAPRSRENSDGRSTPITGERSKAHSSR